MQSIYKLYLRAHRRSRIDLNYAMSTPFSFAFFVNLFQTEVAE